MKAPTWFEQLKWSPGITVSALNQDRSLIPDFTGCYVFTVGQVPIAPGRVMYVGEAARQTLRARLANYLVDYRQPKRRESHKGKGFVLEARQQAGDHGVYVSWVEYGASPDDIHILEASLIHFLNPAANDRIDEERHPVLGDRERLNPGLIR